MCNQFFKKGQQENTRKDIELEINTSKSMSHHQIKTNEGNNKKTKNVFLKITSNN